MPTAEKKYSLIREPRKRIIYIDFTCVIITLTWEIFKRASFWKQFISKKRFQHELLNPLLNCIELAKNKQKKNISHHLTIGVNVIVLHVFSLFMKIISLRGHINFEWCKFFISKRNTLLRIRILSPVQETIRNKDNSWKILEEKRYYLKQYLMIFSLISLCFKSI